ncbi:cation diffusion facilitator family transporter [Halalkalibacterium halodurans]|uniref:cation diffusion facilitator family transporter n=1 Tax=Halalkalibacterium halodurans TaxID=86665 RepID=UPI002AA99149|nr:cation diffusion facilitator family transporter [Halalkalibacterium halodurans]MDY7221203.1 cation diffusion facilitator family transporter [Halalkalibacterium halodurans]MDY7240442.1 cation diffusion facilitator family transporter [Halalkalibacterium halodurans]
MESRFKEAEFATWVGIIVNGLLALMKGVIGWLSGSRALIADAAHSASDVAGSIAVLAGLRTAKKPPDADHPYGHGKAENVATIIVAILLIVVGVEIAISSTKVFVGEMPSAPKGIALVAIIASIIIKEVLFQYKYRLAKKINSSALLAEAWHHRSDALSSIAAFIGVFGAMVGQHFNYPILVYLDPVAGLIVSLIVIKIGFSLAKESSSIMMEQVLDPEKTKPFIRTVSKIEGVKRIDELLARTHGHYIVVDIKVGVDPNLSVEEGHRISKRVKKALLANHSHIKRVFVHINPYQTEGDLNRQERIN